LSHEKEKKKATGPSTQDKEGEKNGEKKEKGGRTCFCPGGREKGKRAVFLRARKGEKEGMDHRRREPRPSFIRGRRGGGRCLTSHSSRTGQKKNVQKKKNFRPGRKKKKSLLSYHGGKRNHLRGGGKIFLKKKGRPLFPKPDEEGKGKSEAEKERKSHFRLVFFETERKKKKNAFPYTLIATEKGERRKKKEIRSWGGEKTLFSIIPREKKVLLGWSGESQRKERTSSMPATSERKSSCRPLPKARGEAKTSGKGGGRPCLQY